MIGFLQNLAASRFKSLAVIFFLTLLAFSSTFPNGFVLDDFDYFLRWTLIHDWKNLPRFFVGFSPPPGQEGIYSPFKTLVHALLYHFFGLKPFGYHVVSLLIHAAGVYYVYAIFRRLTTENLTAFLAGLFFALHPVHAEIIFNITGSVDALGVVFLFASFHAYLQAYDEQGRIRRKFYFGSILLSFLAIYTHELCIALPLLWLWYDACFRWDVVPLRQRLLRLAPFFVIAVSYVLAKFFVLGSVTRGAYLYDSFYLTMLVVIKAWARYVGICFFPVVLTHNHVISDGIFSFDAEDFDKAAVLSQSILDPQVVLSLALLGLIGYAAAGAWRRYPLVPFCVGWFFISLLPGANLVPSSVYFAERYLYPGTLGFCLLMGLGAQRLLLSSRTVGRVRLSLLAVFGLILLTAYDTGRTWLRGRDFRNNVTLFESAVRANPQSALMHTDLGIVYRHKGDYGKAVASLEKAATIRPEDPAIYFALAGVFKEIRQYKKAIVQYQMAIALDPEFAEAHYNLAGIYARWGMDREAKESLGKAVEYLRKRGETAKAVQFEKAFTDYFGSLP